MKKLLQNFISSRDVPEKYRNKAEMKERKKTIYTLHLLHIFAVFLAFFCLYNFLYFFQVHPWLK